MDPFNVVLIHPDGYPHAMAFREIAFLIHYSLQSLGRESKATINTLEPQSLNIIVGYHNLRNPAILQDRRYIIYQLEQLTEDPDWFDQSMIEMLKNAQAIWDYSLENIQYLRDRGFKHLRHLPIGFHPSLQTIPQTESDIDVLFYGAVNDRREKILAALRPHCRIEELFDVYGQQRDAHIARSKIVLNIHFYESAIMEQVRLSYLLNNARCVMSEESTINPFKDMLITAPYDRLVETCLTYLKDDSARQSAAKRGFDLFRQRPMTDFLRPLITS
jgi:hypothetical protein